MSYRRYGIPFGHGEPPNAGALLLGREDAGKRARLAQLTRQLVVIDEKRRYRLDVTA